MIMKIV